MVRREEGDRTRRKSFDDFASAFLDEGRGPRRLGLSDVDPFRAGRAVSGSPARPTNVAKSLAVSACRGEQKERRPISPRTSPRRPRIPPLRSGGRHALGELAQRALAAFADHPESRLDDGVEDAVYPSVFAPHRTECEIEVALFGVAVAAHRQQLVFLPDALTGLLHLFIERTDLGPDFGQTSRPGFPSAQGCLSPGIGLHASLLRSASSCPRKALWEACPDRC